MKQSYLYVGEGDVVEVTRRVSGREVFQAEVLHVEPNYYSSPERYHQRAPFLTVRRLDTGEKQVYSAWLVSRVISRHAEPRRQPQNGFAKYRYLANRVQTNNKDVWSGDLETLILRVLAFMPLDLPGELTTKPLFILDLYRKQSAGFLRFDVRSGKISVRAKPFRKWVERNARRLCITEQERYEVANYNYLADDDDWYDDDINCEEDDSWRDTADLPEMTVVWFD